MQLTKSDGLNILSSEKKKLDLIQEQSSDFFVHRLSEADFTSISLESHALTVFYACGIHDFRSQEKGFDNAERYSSVFLAPNGDFVETSIELYVKSIGANEPLMKISGLAEQCDPGNLIVMVWTEARKELGIICLNIKESLFPFLTQG